MTSYTKTYKYEIQPDAQCKVLFKLCIQVNNWYYNQLFEWILRDRMMFFEYNRAETADQKDRIFSDILKHRSLLSGCSRDESHEEQKQRVTAAIQYGWTPPLAKSLTNVVTRLRSRLAAQRDVPKDLAEPEGNAQGFNVVASDVYTAAKKIRRTDEIRNVDGRWEVRRKDATGEWFMYLPRGAKEKTEWHPFHKMRYFPKWRRANDESSFVVSAQTPRFVYFKTNGTLYPFGTRSPIHVPVYVHREPFRLNEPLTGRIVPGQGSIGQHLRVVVDTVGRWWMCLPVEYEVADVVRDVHNPDTAIAMHFSGAAIMASSPSNNPDVRVVDHTLSSAVNYVRSENFPSPETVTATISRLVTRIDKLKSLISRKANERAVKNKLAATGEKCPYCGHTSPDNVESVETFHGKKRRFLCKSCGYDSTSPSKNMVKLRLERAKLNVRLTNLRKSLRSAFVSAIVSDPQVDTIVMQELPLQPITRKSGTKLSGSARRRANINKALSSLAPGIIRSGIQKKCVELQKNVVILKDTVDTRGACLCGQAISADTRICPFCGEDLTYLPVQTLLTSAYTAPKTILGARSGHSALAAYDIAPKQKQAKKLTATPDVVKAPKVRKVKERRSHESCEG